MAKNWMGSCWIQFVLLSGSENRVIDMIGSGDSGGDAREKLSTEEQKAWIVLDPL